MHVEAAGDEAVDDVLDLGVRGAFSHYDDHVRAGFLSIVAAKTSCPSAKTFFRGGSPDFGY